MMEHTPGPWKHDAMWGLIKGPNYEEVCAVHSGAAGDLKRVHRNIAKANADLIASAPDLLLALKGLTKEINLSKLNVRKDFSLLNAHACATKAIWKAEGGA